MKIVIGYPPLPRTSDLGVPLVSQNRQFQYFNYPTFIYPVVPAYAATMLKREGHDVRWLDGPAEDYTWPEYLDELIVENPDLIAWEVKTPTVKRVWPLVNEVKRRLPDTTVVLMGDHITALPEETLENSQTDIALKGGDFDFALVDIASRIASGDRPHGVIDFPTTTPLTNLPLIDRELTKWRLYAKANGNFKHLPGTYTYFGRDCWWRRDGGCTFCSWTNTFKNFRVIPVERAIDEVMHCDSLGIREIFDDTGTFPVKNWLEEFCEKLIHWKEKTGSRIRIGCNMRPGALDQRQYNLLGRAGFRFILFGLESANDKTLERINKGQSPGDMERSAKMAKLAGLDPHVTCMVGYPWESMEEARRTIEFTRNLFRKGYIETLQATIVVPYPGTALYRQCVENGWLKYAPGDWNQWDMRRPVMTHAGTDDEIMSLTRGIYKSCITPHFLLRKILSIRTKDDLQFMGRAAAYLGGHLKDFAHAKKKADAVRESVS